jgi:hypothetical protein
MVSFGNVSEEQKLKPTELFNVESLLPCLHRRKHLEEKLI